MNEDKLVTLILTAEREGKAVDIHGYVSDKGHRLNMTAHFPGVATFPAIMQEQQVWLQQVHNDPTEVAAVTGLDVEQVRSIVAVELTSVTAKVASMSKPPLGPSTQAQQYTAVENSAHLFRKDGKLYLRNFRVTNGVTEAVTFTSPKAKILARSPVEANFRFTISLQPGKFQSIEPHDEQLPVPWLLATSQG